MSTKLGIHFILLLSLFAVALNVSNAEKKAKDSIPTSPKAEDAKRESQNVENPKKEDPEVKSKEDKAEEKQDPDDLEYNKGSLCGYCSYCKFCKLCDKDCPCQKSASKPNCHMCKYCKYCYLCKLACQTVCQPGGFIDVVSTTLYNQLPRFNKAEVDKDLDEMKDWMERVKHEL